MCFAPTQVHLQPSGLTRFRPLKPYQTNPRPRTQPPPRPVTYVTISDPDPPKPMTYCAPVQVHVQSGPERDEMFRIVSVGPLILFVCGFKRNKAFMLWLALTASGLHPLVHPQSCRCKTVCYAGSITPNTNQLSQPNDIPAHLHALVALLEASPAHQKQRVDGQ